MPDIGRNELTPLRVAIIGAGPAGFYAAEHLEKQAELFVEIDMFDRLPTPFGLVRGGVAPDHQKIKSVTKIYTRIASHEQFRFFGNVEIGKDLSHDDLLKYYHAVIYAVGAQSDRALGIPGEDLSGSHAATEFVGWYNGHPDYRDFEFDLSQKAVAVIGVGNVAMDVVRILGQSVEALAQTDIADYALEALEKSEIETIYVLGRRGPVQAAFTNPEIKELGELDAADIIVRPEDMELDEYSKEELEEGNDRSTRRNVEILESYVSKPLENKPRKIIMYFLTSPLEMLGEDHVEGLKVVRNELYKNDLGIVRPRATNHTEILPVGLVFRSVGYRGVPLPDLPFDERRGIFPNDHGRLVNPEDPQKQAVGEYVTGWIKRGPSGVIGTNKPDAVETVNLLLEDFEDGVFNLPGEPARDVIPAILRERGVRYVTFEDWQKIDLAESRRGEEQGRPRVKFTSISDMLDVLESDDS